MTDDGTKRTEYACYCCRLYSEEHDPHSGVSERECMAEDGFWDDFGRRPCPNFVPFLASDGLTEEEEE